MRSIVCVMISFVCWYVSFHVNQRYDYRMFRAGLIIAGFGSLVASFVLMILGL